jgi:hypothetical protein
MASSPSSLYLFTDNAIIAWSLCSALSTQAAFAFAAFVCFASSIVLAMDVPSPTEIIDWLERTCVSTHGLEQDLLATYSYVAGCTRTREQSDNSERRRAERPYLLRFGAGSWVTVLSSSSEHVAPWISAPSPSCKQGAQGHMLNSQITKTCGGGAGDSALLLGALHGPAPKRSAFAKEGLLDSSGEVMEASASTSMGWLVTRGCGGPPPGVSVPASGRPFGAVDCWSAVQPGRRGVHKISRFLRLITISL